MNKTALTKTYTKDIQNSCLNSKKIVLSLATISFWQVVLMLHLLLK